MFSTSRAAASPEVLGSFSTYQQVESTCASLPHSLRSVSRVSHPPDGLLLACLPGLVSCPCALGVPSLQSFAHDTAAVRPLDRTSALLHLTAGACAASRLPELSADPSGFGHPARAELWSCFRALFRDSCSDSPPGPSGPRSVRGSPGFRLPSRVLRPGPCSACFHRCSFLELDSPASPRTQPRPSSRATGFAGSSKSSRARDRPRPHDWTRYTLLGFFHLVAGLVDASAPPSWLMVSPRVPRLLAEPSAVPLRTAAAGD